MPRMTALAWGLATVVVASGLARAEQPPTDKKRAAALAAEAERLGRDKRYDAALERYKEAARLDPDTPAYQCNVGMAYYALANYPRAHLYLSRCEKANGGWPDNVLEVFRYVESVLSQQDYTPVTIQGSPAGAEVEISYYADEGPSIAPVTFYVPFARYEVNIKAPGYQPATIEINAVDRNGMARSYALARAPDAEAGVGDVGATGPAGGSSVGEVGGGAALGGEIGGSAPAPRARPVWPLVMAGGGVLSLAAGGLAFRSAYNLSKNGTCDPEDVGPDGKCPRGPVLVREVIAYSLMGAGAAAITAGLILYFREPSGDSNAPLVSAGPLEDGGMVFFTWSK